MSESILKNLRVVDDCWDLACSVAPQILGELGFDAVQIGELAEGGVIKISRPSSAKMTSE